MNQRENYLKQKWCNEVLKIWIYPTPVGGISNIKIVIETNGVKKVGSVEYSQKPTRNEPRYENIINQLYIDYYNLNFNNKY